MSTPADTLEDCGGQEGRPARLASLDALRGLDMLIIAGLDTLAYAIAMAAPDSAAAQGLRQQLTHVDWEGLVAYDLVFPLFVFLAGASMRLSLARRAQQGIGWPRLLGKMWVRAAILVVLGWAVNGMVSLDAGMRCASVLGLIGLSGALAGSLALLLRRSALSCAVCGGVILLAVGLCQHLGGDYTVAGSFNAQVDALLCPGHLYRAEFDPEGPLCIVSATALCLFGYAAGSLLSRPARKGLGLLTAAGVALIAASMFLPCIKNIWTAGFVLASAGTCSLLLALFHLLLDILPWRKWAFPFQVVGCNALFLYLLVNLLPVENLARRLTCGVWQSLLEPRWLPVAYAATALLLVWLAALFLYRRKVFIKL